ncbi:hypothetical protein TUM4438_40480 [Shewanella sairae]|uniref:Uncharacterized protein n=1 Tax=Shewanella sairae TaxID=190310 RepID=A0ABQ4PQC6_9GAMM|nr:hypothetical protein [Shewanella sairae]MCL1132252.1 hypothetical protein [Shewanella sairae]GIU51308.1 hypothetical protein TUM4438_40480 [Shewanella sairae]
MTKPTPQAQEFIYSRTHGRPKAITDPKPKPKEVLYYAKARAGVGEHLERVALARELGIPLSELEDF